MCLVCETHTVSQMDFFHRVIETDVVEVRGCKKHVSTTKVSRAPGNPTNEKRDIEKSVQITKAPNFLACSAHDHFLIRLPLKQDSEIHLWEN